MPFWILGVTKEEIGTFTVYKGKGCSNCNNGYKGRIALYEVMPIHEEIKELVLNGASSAEIRREASRLGMDSLRRSGIKKMMAGVTTPEEVVRCSVKE